MPCSNHDPQSWYHSRENNVLVDDRETVKMVMGAMLVRQQSLGHCDSFGNTIDTSVDKSD